MNRVLGCFAAAPLVATLVAAGCQNSAWQNPYAALGPATIPAANRQSPPAEGYYLPPSSNSTQPAGAAAAATPATGTASPSAEQPIRIVEASPANKNAATAKPTFDTKPGEQPPAAVVAAAPARRTPSSSSEPAVKFNPVAAPAEMLPLPPATTPAVNRTPGYLPSIPGNPMTPAVPKNRLSASPATRGDAAVAPASFVETPIEAAGQWKAR